MCPENYVLTSEYSYLGQLGNEYTAPPSVRQLRLGELILLYHSILIDCQNQGLAALANKKKRRLS